MKLEKSLEDGTPEALVIDASALVDLLLGRPLGQAVATRIHQAGLHAPAHVDAEVLSALGRLQRGRQLPEASVTRRLRLLAEASVERHPVAPLLLGAWRRRKNLRLADALYVELAAQLDMPLITTDARLAVATSNAELVNAS